MHNLTIASLKRRSWEATRDVSFNWLSTVLFKTKQFRIFENMKSQIQILRLAPKGLEEPI